MTVVRLVALADYRPEGVLQDCLGHHDDASEVAVTRGIVILVVSDESI